MTNPFKIISGPTADRIELHSTAPDSPTFMVVLWNGDTCLGILEMERSMAAEVGAGFIAEAQGALDGQFSVIDLTPSGGPDERA